MRSKRADRLVEKVMITRKGDYGLFLLQKNRKGGKMAFPSKTSVNQKTAEGVKTVKWHNPSC